MSKIASIKYQNLDHLLSKNLSKYKPDEPFTHTRIGNKDKGGNIWAGCYTITDDLMPQFWNLYYKKVFEKGEYEYLTEAQYKENGGPLLVDIDMKFDISVKDRTFGLNTISDIVELYSEGLAELFNFESQVTIPIYVFHKDKVVQDEAKNYTKDGLHLVIGINMKHIHQEILRDIIITKERDETKIFGEEGLNCINPLENIFDDCITSGKTNWQVWGSRKPGFDAYKLKSVWESTIQGDEVEFEPIDMNTINIKNMLPIISARNKEFQKHPIIKKRYEQKVKKLSEEQENKKKKKKIINSNKNLLSNINLSNLNINLKLPKSSEELDTIIKRAFETLDFKDYYIKELHDLVMILDKTYYDPFQKWIEVGWALHNTHDLLFWTWVKFSSKSEKFSWNSIPELILKWNNEMLNSGKSWRSIHYWCQNDFPDKYKEIHDTSIQKALYATLKSCGADTDIAILVKFLYKGEYSCSSISHNKWYRFNKHRWVENDCGVSLRCQLSSRVSRYFVDEAKVCKDLVHDDTLSTAQKDQNCQTAAAFNRTAMNLKTASKKNNIMSECKEQFYDHGLLAKKLDQNKMLLGFENGLYDFENKIFRDGEPEDYLSFSTRTNYIPYDKNDTQQRKIKDEIDDFMLKIFPNKQLRKYMWEHAASALIGVQRNQKFNIYTGCGSNGKSMFVNLMNLTLGDYADKLNIALVTQKRKGIGGPTPEIAKLKGKRYVSMDEPSAGDQLNEGIMKQMVGGDEMEGREMYGRHMIKFYPQFELVCCTNRLFEINSNDKGTWRRIRQVDFKSEFIDSSDYKKREEQNLCNDAEYPIYLKDDTLEKKFPNWVQVFTALLIEIVNKTGGKVVDCPQVIEASERYQEKQDYYALFCKEKIRKASSEDKIKKTDIRNQFQSWYQENYQAKPPKSMDLYDQLDKRLGKYRKKGWWGYKIIYDPTESEDEEDESTD